MNRFFGEGNNIGVDYAHGDFIVFLNNDAFVQPGWIEALAATMRSDPAVAAVGPDVPLPRWARAGGRRRHRGDGRCRADRQGSVWGPDHYDTPCPVDYCSAACLMMRRADFLKVGGFGLEWEPAYYEDTDLCLKLWTQCGKVMVNPNARVVHIESKTTSDRRLQLHDISEINRARFVEEMGPLARGAPDLAPGQPGRRHRSRRRRARHADLDLRWPADGTRSAVRPVLPLPTRSGRRRADAVRAGVAFLRPGRDVQCGVRLAAPLQHHADPPDRGDVRIRQTSSAPPLPWDEVEPDNGAASPSCIGNSIVPPSQAFGTTQRVPHPIPVLGARPASSRTAVCGSPDYDEIWVYSEFVRRNVNGLDPPLRSGGPAHPAHPAPRHVVRGHQRPPLGRAPDDPDGRALLHRRPQQAPGRRDRSLPPHAESGTERHGAGAGGRHPPQPRGQGPLPRVAAPGRRARLHASTPISAAPTWPRSTSGRPC